MTTPLKTLILLIGAIALLAPSKPTAPKLRYQDITVCGARPGEMMSETVKRLGKPHAQETPVICSTDTYLYFNTPQGNVSVAGKLIAHEVDGDSLEISGRPVAKVGYSRAQILGVIGPPELSIEPLQSTIRIDDYCDEKLILSYDNDRLTQVTAVSDQSRRN